jgi:hypothetical protein
VKPPSPAVGGRVGGHRVPQKQEGFLSLGETRAAEHPLCKTPELVPREPERALEGKTGVEVARGIQGSPGGSEVMSAPKSRSQPPICTAIAGGVEGAPQLVAERTKAPAST